MIIVAASAGSKLLDFANEFMSEVKIFLPKFVTIEDIPEEHIIKHDYTDKYVLRFGENKVALFYDYWGTPLLVMTYSDPKCFPQVFADEIMKDVKVDG